MYETLARLYIVRFVQNRNLSIVQSRHPALQRRFPYSEVLENLHEPAEIGAIFVVVLGLTAKSCGKNLMNALGGAVRHDFVDVPDIVGVDDGLGRGLLGFQAAGVRTRTEKGNHRTPRETGCAECNSKL